MQICARCGDEYGEAYFRYKGEKVDLCRPCRKREADRKRIRMQRQDGKDTARLTLRVVRRLETNQGLSTSRIKKRLKTRFLDVTRVTRSRLRVMGMKADPSVKTERAVAERTRLLAKYQNAYDLQLKMLDKGVEPPDISVMVVD